jgi:type IV pilus assembly protein PilN
MRVNINLATNPYEAAQEYTRRAVILVAALSVLAIALMGYIAYQRSHTRGVNQEISAARQEIASLNGEQAQALALLNKPQNREIVDQSQFLNTLFARKALSWTKVFTEMEKLMPAAIHVVSMKPEFNRDNQLVLHMVVATNSRDKAVELVGKMEKSPHFRTPQVETENTTGNAGDVAAGGNIQFEIAAVYLPFAEDTVADADSGKDAESGGDQQQKTGGNSAGAKTAATANKPVIANKTATGPKRPTGAPGKH